jgi:hypothetical protein
MKFSRAKASPAGTKGHTDFGQDIVLQKISPFRLSILCPFPDRTEAFLETRP